MIEKECYLKVINALGLPDEFEFEFEFVDGEEIKALNLEHRGKDAVTDVLSFPYTNFKFPYKKADYLEDINPESGKIMLGSVVIFEEQMKKQAEEYGNTALAELGFLITHGLLHLLGFDHETEEDRLKMRTIEKKVAGEQ